MWKCIIQNDYNVRISLVLLFTLDWRLFESLFSLCTFIVYSKKNKRFSTGNSKHIAHVKNIQENIYENDESNSFYYLCCANMSTRKMKMCTQFHCLSFLFPFMIFSLFSYARVYSVFVLFDALEQRNWRRRDEKSVIRLCNFYIMSTECCSLCSTRSINWRRCTPNSPFFGII